MSPKKISSTSYVALLALYFTVFQNIALWNHLVKLVSAEPVKIGFLISLPVFVFITMFVLFTIIVWPYVYRVLVGVLILLSTLVTYSMFNYGNYFNYGMIVSVFQTNSAESLSYLSYSVAIWFVLLGVIPAILFCYYLKPVFNRSVVKTVLAKLSGIVAAILVCLFIAALYYKDYVSFIRNHTEIKSLLNPTDYITSTYRYEHYVYVDSKIPYKKIGLDATNTHKGQQHNILVLVVGEASRSMNYSLNGYHRDTNPELAKHKVISFQDVSSCGTYTALSVPCMFSDMNRSNYNETIAHHQDGLMDILAHAGLDVSWRENDGGCKGVCDRVKHIEMTANIDPALCHNGTCYDEILLKGLKEKIANAKQDTVIALHLIGSHGPTYLYRYPPNFEKFKPICNTSNLQDCTSEQITNTYDNTILYTDHILSTVIDTLKTSAGNNNTAMFYLADHGESLGENGIYLHGLPYSIAPIEQKRVPMIVWLSKAFQTNNGLNAGCLENEAQHKDTYSQDNLFHSILGLMDVTTHLYKPDLDVFRQCRN
ncbi:phosphoethanolamine--lipid A transferase [Vibrio sp. S4M6]|uniref:phosphoethanolamine transferase n=1 Tax=Vibrio sinus TaxID=2946865 RepID=UPI00202A2EDC|nr:phosphoethanolamine--lipid A transferase [Vibrio sinus]MCL9782130.1 phosphoethanolamine--lipid A transferase [Vibrio sinus]